MSSRNLLWLDFESTGLDLHDDDALEVFAVVENSEGLQWGSAVESLVAPSDEALARAHGNQFVEPMHTVNGLFDDIEAARNAGTLPTLTQVETSIIAMLEETGSRKGRVTLAGSGVGHFDILFIQARMPELASWLTYFVHDIGVQRRAYARANNGALLVRVNNDKTHRAKQDVECHLAEDAAFNALYSDARVAKAG